MKALNAPIWQYISVIVSVVSFVYSTGHPDVALFFGIVATIFTVSILFASYMSRVDYTTASRVRIVMSVLSALGLLYLSTPQYKARIFAANPTQIGAFIKPHFQQQIWNQDGFILTLESTSFYTNTTLISWSITNSTGQDISIPLIYYEGFYAKDNLNNAVEMRTYACYNNVSSNTDCREMGTLLKANSVIGFAQQLDFIKDKSSATQITVTALNIPRTLQTAFTFTVER